MKKTYFLIVFFGAITAYSQQISDTTEPKKLKEIHIITERYSKSTQDIKHISRKEIEFQKNQNTADLLANTGTVSVQKSQQGGGSPVLRGFEANKILLLVDGIRMNNLIYRAGHLQNIITVDENSLEQIDVLFGPASTIFGSDALGGAINMRTKNPLFLSQTDNKVFSGNAMSRYNSANNGFTQHFDLNFAGKRWSSLSSFSYNDYGDLRMGGNSNGKNESFGERPQYVETTNNVDYLVQNKNPLIQKFSGYKQYNVMQKILFQPDEYTQHSLNLQYSTSSDVPRYDRLTDPSGAGLKHAVWNYGPQKRFLSAYKFSKQKALFNSDMNLGMSYQNIEESRISRKFNDDKTKSQVEKVNVFAFNADFRTKLGKGDFLYGTEFFYDNLNSTATSSNRITGIVSPTDTRYPNGINHTFRADVFATYNEKINETTFYNLGIRTGYSSLKSTIANNSFFRLPYDVIEQSNFTYSGTAGIAKNFESTKLVFNLASGYRVPNVDDLGKLFESVPGTLIVPNRNIAPEKSVTADFTIALGQGKRIQFDNTVYYTRLFDAIVTDHFLYNGQSSVIYEGVQSEVFAMQNKGNAYVGGFSSTLKMAITKPLGIYGTVTFTKGEIMNRTGNTPLDHISPIYGKAGLKYENKIILLDFYTLFNGKKDISDYSTNGEDNQKYAPKGGMPSWQTFNFKTSFMVDKNISLYAGIENILDLQYRVFASGINASGRNISVAAKYHF
ncbi:TonB-dependent siderophore receptor [Flavobacterium sp. B183]|uniref:TonB-dependent receptor plug domain-containing protein n=1 Tax=Flavobacterium sp. B183 TaxID=907046 RepID=UPI00201EA8BD|nr:TonB-dependent receptor [Flavobacterium sp. B183]URC13384.1 TonB-dependent receptor [Flavobacterium sp. B183]